MSHKGTSHVEGRLVLPLAGKEVVMTLPPERIGDKGQRYEIKYRDVNTNVEKVFGWSDTQGGCAIMLRSIKLHPSMKAGRVVDRKPGAPARKPGGSSQRGKSRAKQRTETRAR